MELSNGMSLNPPGKMGDGSFTFLAIFQIFFHFFPKRSRLTIIILYFECGDKIWADFEVFMCG